MTVTKAVIPAAGLGTRFLPATKAMPKEMLPVVDKPAIQYVVEEAARAGLDDVLMILGRNKNAISNHFDRVTELESTLEIKGDEPRLQKVQESTDLADVHFVRQGDPKGLGHAVLRARQHVGNQSFAVLLGDDLIDERENLLQQMSAEYDQRGEFPRVLHGLNATPAALAMRSRPLAEQVSWALQQMLADGSLDALFNRYGVGIADRSFAIVGPQ